MKNSTRDCALREINENEPVILVDGHLRRRDYQKLSPQRATVAALLMQRYIGVTNNKVFLTRRAREVLFSNEGDAEKQDAAERTKRLRQERHQRGFRQLMVWVHDDEREKVKTWVEENTKRP